MKKAKRFFSFLLAAVLLLTPFQTVDTSAAIEYQTVSYGGTTYKKQCVYAAIGNLSIDHLDMPGFIKDDTCVYPAKSLFGGTSAFDTTYSYNSSTKKVVMTRTVEGSTKTLTYTLNSRTCYLNGKAYTAPTTPVMATTSSGISCVVVPGGFTAEKLGLNYEWNNSLKTATFTVPSTTSYQTVNYDGDTETVRKITIKVGTSTVTSKMYAFTEGQTVMVPATSVFNNYSTLGTTYTYNSSTKKITIKRNGHTLIMQVGSTAATLDGTSKIVPVAPISAYNHNNKTTYTMVPVNFVAEQLGLSFTLNNYTGTITTSGSSGNDNLNDPDYQTLKINGTDKTLKRVKARLGDINITTPIDGYFSNNVALFSAQSIFSKSSALGISYSYNSSTKKATLVRGSKKIIFKIGSKTATVNGSSKKLDTAPSYVYNYANKANYVMIPGKFTAQNLGLTYSYNSSTRMATIRVPATSTKHTYSYNNTTYTQNKRYVTVNGKKVSTPFEGFSKNGNTMVSAKYVFGNSSDLGISYNYNSDTKQITLKKGSNTLIYTIGSKIATFNGKSVTADEAPVYTYSHETGYYYNMVPASFTAAKFGLNYTWVSSSCTAKIVDPASNTVSGRNVFSTKTLLTASASNYCVRITRPSGVEAGTVTAYDDYSNKKLYIYFKGGNYTSFLNSSSSRSVKTSPSSISATYSSSSNRTNLCIKTSSIKGFSVVEDGNYIYIRWADPGKMFKNVICLDAGHGGTDSGAVGNGLYEKTLTLKIVKAAKEYFDEDSNYKVYYTRLSDWYPSLSYRYNLSNSVDADMFISVHCDSADRSSAGGTSVLYNTTSGRHTSPESSLTSYRLADYCLDYVLGATGFTGRSDKLVLRNNLAVLNGTRTASALNEVGFITKSSEAKWINEHPSTLGKAIYNSAVKATKNYPTSK